MTTKAIPNPYLGHWIYRSLYNNPDVTTDFDKLEIRRGILIIDQDERGALVGTLGQPGEEMKLYGSFGFGAGESCRFRASGVIAGQDWCLDFFAVAVPIWPSSTPAEQVPTLVGSVTRVNAHPSAAPGAVDPAGAVGTIYAVRLS